IDLNQPIAVQGPFDVIIHKLSDVMVDAEHDSQSQQLLERFEGYTAGHPRTVLLDPLPAMRRLLDRFASYRIMEGLQTAIPVCKTRVAHGSSSHEMSLIFGPAGLWDARPPCVLQSFINHSAVLHKVFVVGGAHFTVERPSLKNFPRGHSALSLSLHLTLQLDEEAALPRPPCDDVIAAIVTELRAELGMSLFGVDVIVNTETGRHTVIDINIFPGQSHCWGRSACWSL
ncbi:UNVERIFIED_CONTAM: hypothetical protein FKN15_020106, partial [Acipenser sinensis]